MSEGTPDGLTAMYEAEKSRPWAKTAFACAACGADAACVSLHSPVPSRAKVLLHVESGQCKTLRWIDEDLAAVIEDAINARDAAWLHLATDGEAAPFFCTRCHAVYCGDCMTLSDDEEGGSSVAARCPQGHLNRL